MQAEKLFEDALLAQQNGEVERALDLFGSVVLVDPKHAAAWMFRGLLEDRMERPFNAMLHLEHSLMIDPRRQDAWCNLGIILAKLGLYERSEMALKKSLELGDAFEPHQNLGDLYIRLMRLRDAEKEYRAAIKCRPDDAHAHANLGRVLIARGRWNAGHYENQHRHRIYPIRERLMYPPWSGENLYQTILLYPEGGYGDEILGMRYAIALKDKFPKANAILEVRAPLFSIAQRSLKHYLYVIPQFDTPPYPPVFCCGLSDIPLWLGLSADTVPYSDRYLFAPDGPAFNLPGMVGKPRVGLCWLSGKRPLQPWTDKIAKTKSIPLEMLAGLADCGVQLVSLQLDRADGRLMSKMGIFPMPEVHDFADTARLIDQLDLVISVDTAVAHLAGAMGKPVWNLIRFNEIVTYPPGAVFYKSMRFYRQEKIDDWSGAIERVVNDLLHLSRDDLRPADPEPT